MIESCGSVQCRQKYRLTDRKKVRQTTKVKNKWLPEQRDETQFSSQVYPSFINKFYRL